MQPVFVFLQYSERRLITIDVSKTIIMTVQYLAILILFVELVYVLSKKPSETQKYVVIISISTILMFVGYIVELKAATLEAAMIGTAVSYIGKPYVMLSSFLFICSYYNRRIPRWLSALLFVYCAFFPVLVFTNRYHHLYYATAEYVVSDAYSPLVITHGKLYNLYTFTIVGFFLLCIWVVIKGYSGAKGKERFRLAFYSLMMVVSGIVGYAVYLAGVTNGYDSTMLGVFFGVIFLFIISIRCRVFDIVIVAKEHALDNSPTGLFVFDKDDRLAYKNKLAEQLSRDSNVMEHIMDSNRKTATLLSQDRTYSVFRNSMDANGSYLGQSVELTDITDAHNYQTRLEHDIRERTEELEAIQRQIIGSFANIVEARSYETGEHIKRTSDFARQIAEALVKRGKYTEILTKEYIDLLVSAMPLHDIGKISVPDDILLKPGKLTPEEFEIMKTHSQNGARIIENTIRGLESDAYLNMAVNIARFHHERWDGTGYPCRLKGTDIPLEARIAAVADCFDAIMSKRCYKDPVDRPDAVRIMLSESGTHFEPELVDALVSCF